MDEKYSGSLKVIAEWLSHILSVKANITEKIHEINDLQEIETMLEENAANWKYEYIDLGRKEGRLESAQDSVLRLLEVRFGAVPAAVRTSVQAISSLDMAKDLLTVAYRARDMQDFEQILAKSIG